MREHRDIPATVTIYFGLAAIFVATILFLVLIPSTLTDIPDILNQPTSAYLLFGISVDGSVVILLLVLVVAVLASSIYLVIFRQIGKVSESESGRSDFFRFFSIFVLVEYLISAVSELVPGNSVPEVYSQSLGVQNFVFSVSTLSELLILQFIPLFIMVSIYFAATRKLTFSNIMHPYKIMKKDIMLPAVIASAVTAALISQDYVNAFFNLLAFLVLDYIYLRFGIFQAFLAGFTVTMLGILTALSTIPLLSLGVVVFITLWSLIGLFNTMRASANRRPQKLHNLQPEDALGATLPPVPKPVYAESNMIWIRSTCPNCGNASFYIRESMQLECMKCHHTLSRDAVGPANIILEQRRALRV
ncbi:MAG: hypothetical protein QW597_00895 [Thermoplasmataceae archaeon]